MPVCLLKKSGLTLMCTLIFMATTACEMAPPPRLEATILKMADGDSGEARLASSRKTVTIRLYGIDAPEKGQAFSQRAKAFSQELLKNQKVLLEVLETDSFGRQIVKVHLADGTLANHRIVAAGYAWWFRRYAPHDLELPKLEEDARAAQLGLWQDPSPVPPWEFRHQKRSEP